MKKAIVIVFVLVFCFAAATFARQLSQATPVPQEQQPAQQQYTQQQYAQQDTQQEPGGQSKMLYLQIDFWQGYVFKMDGHNESLKEDNPIFQRLIAKSPEAQRHLSEFYSKRTTAILIDVVSILIMCGGVGGGTYMALDGNNADFAIGMTLLGVGTVVGCIGTIVGSVMQMDSMNELFRAVHEYNKSRVTMSLLDPVKDKGIDLGMGVNVLRF